MTCYKRFLVCVCELIYRYNSKNPLFLMLITDCYY